MTSNQSPNHILKINLEGHESLLQPIPESDLKQDLESVVIRAGSAIMEVYEKDFEFNKKSDGSPVTEADKLSENIIIPALKDLCPDIPIISEENSNLLIEDATSAGLNIQSFSKFSMLEVFQKKN